MGWDQTCLLTPFHNSCHGFKLKPRQELWNGGSSYYDFVISHRFFVNICPHGSDGCNGSIFSNLLHSTCVRAHHMPSVGL